MLISSPAERPDNGIDDAAARPVGRSSPHPGAIAVFTIMNKINIYITIYISII